MKRVYPSQIFRRYYHSNVVEHFENPRNVGSLNKDDKDIGTGLVGAPACGDLIKLQIKVNKDGIITDSKHKVFGCGSAQASSSVTSEWIKNKHIDEAIKITNKDIAQYLKLPPVKIHCSLLSEDSIKSAINDYKTKNKIE